MQTGYYAAAGGMVTQFNRLDNIANNLANVNTVGFKKDNLITGDFMRMYQEARDALPNANQTKEGAQFINRTMTRTPQIVEQFTDHTLGGLNKTDNTFDFALGKEGLFFAVKTPQGIRLTRDGSFTLNEEGKLLTKQGYEVLPADYAKTKEGIAFNVADSAIEADKNGRFYTNIVGTINLVQNKKLMIIQPDELKMLTKEGNSLYKMDESEALTPVEESGAVMQGFVEKSNVNPVQEMVAMIEANRLVGMYQKAMQSQMTDMNKEAIDKIAVVRG